MFQAIIFDYNGVLVNDLEYHVEAYLMAAKEMGYPLLTKRSPGNTFQPRPYRNGHSTLEISLMMPGIGYSNSRRNIILIWLNVGVLCSQRSGRFSILSAGDTSWASSRIRREDILKGPFLETLPSLFQATIFRR